MFSLKLSYLPSSDDRVQCKDERSSAYPCGLTCATATSRYKHNWCVQMRTSFLLLLLHTSSPQIISLWQHTPVGEIAAVCVTSLSCLPESKTSYLSLYHIFYTSYEYKYIFLYQSLVYYVFFSLLNSNHTTALNTVTSTLGDCVPHGEWLLQRGSIYPSNHNQINARKYVSWAEQAWQQWQKCWDVAVCWRKPLDDLFAEEIAVTASLLPAASLVPSGPIRPASNPRYNT